MRAIRESPLRRLARDARAVWTYDGAMTVADISLMVSVLVVVVILAKMVRAIRLLDGRVSVLQEQLEHSRASMQMAAVGKPLGKPSGSRHPDRRRSHRHPRACRAPRDACRGALA